jgi:predicted Zn-dependent protease
VKPRRWLCLLLACPLLTALPPGALAARPQAERRAAAKPLSPVERDYRDALAAISEGHPRIAEAKLVHLLGLAPLDHDARLTLAQLLVEQGRRPESEALLREGFELTPERYALPLAKLQFEDGQYPAVLATLAGLPRQALSDGWRDALEGAAQLASAHATEAVDAFRRALLSDASKLAWSVGLADALRAAERPDEARAVLEAAQARADLSPAQRELLAGRLDALPHSR